MNPASGMLTVTLHRSLHTIDSIQDKLTIIYLVKEPGGVGMGMGLGGGGEGGGLASWRAS